MYLSKVCNLFEIFFYLFSLLAIQSCIKGVNPVTEKLEAVKILDKFNLRLDIKNTASIQIAWDKSVLPTDTFKHYYIEVRGRRRDESVIKSFSIKDIDTVAYNFLGLKSNVSYGFRISSIDVSGKIRGSDEVTIYTDARQLSYNQKGSYTFPAEERVNNFSLLLMGSLVYVATNRNIYRFDQYFKTTPLTVVNDINASLVSATSSHLFYVKLDTLYALNLLTGTRNKRYNLDVRKLKTSLDGKLLFVVTPDSLSVLDVNLNPNTLGIATIQLRDKGITNFANYPAGSPNFYITTESGVYYYQNGVGTLIAEQGEKYYTAVFANSDAIYIGRHARLNDAGRVSSFKNAALEPLANFDIEGGILIKEIFVDNSIFSLLMNNNIYIFVDDVLYLVPPTINSSAGLSDHFDIHQNTDYYVSGKNNISVFTRLF